MPVTQCDTPDTVESEARVSGEDLPIAAVEAVPSRRSSSRAAAMAGTQVRRRIKSVETREKAKKEEAAGFSCVLKAHSLRMRRRRWRRLMMMIMMMIDDGQEEEDSGRRRRGRS